MQLKMSVSEYIEWLKFFELETQDRPGSRGGCSWEQLKHNIAQHNAIVEAPNNARKR